MPLFDFLIQNGKTPLERVEAECAGIEEAKAQALRLAAESIADFSADFWLHPHWFLRVMDDTRTEILMLSFTGANPKGGNPVEG